MRLSKQDLRNMIIEEARNLNGPKETVHKVTAQELRDIISEEIDKASSGKSVLNEFSIIGKAIEMIKPMIAKEFTRVGEDGDYWAGQVINSLLDSGLESRVSVFKLAGLLTDTEAQRDIEAALDFNPMLIVNSENPDASISEIDENVLEVLVRHGYAD